MRRVIEHQGKYYIRETLLNEEATTESLEADLARVTAEKEAYITQARANFDARIAEIKVLIRQLAALKAQES